MDEHLGPGHGRAALDVGSGDGALARHLHHLGYRTTGIDCSPSAIALAASRSSGPGRGPVWRCLDITTGDLTALPEPAYAVITCRLVYRWMADNPAFLDRVRRLLAPGGTFWVGDRGLRPTPARSPPPAHGHHALGSRDARGRMVPRPYGRSGCPPLLRPPSLTALTCSGR
ncbi:class I SAM-dependent methyltransferase [Streptomyces sp. NPDC058955]|uniref:class I SAM-dependent methyltransferase n=1 Tax=Streptomyces sp. NPDC058955 TaxID=3346678 RepID=UPI0036905172